MVISFFKNSRFISVLAIPVSCLVFRAFSLYEPGFTPVADAAPLYSILQDLLRDLPLLAAILGVIGIIAGALMLNHLATEYEILNTASYVPALMYVLLMSLLPSMGGFHPIILANIFLLLVLMKVTGSYRKNEAFSDFFDSGFLLGISALFYLPSVIFMPLVWIGLLIFRPFILREWVVGFVGFLLPFILTGSFFFLFDKLDMQAIRSVIPAIFPAPPGVSAGTSTITILSLLSLIILLSASRINRGVFYNTLRARKNAGILLWTIIFGIISVFLVQDKSEITFSFCTIPFSIFIANYFLSFRRSIWPELLFYAISLSVLANQAIILFKLP